MIVDVAKRLQSVEEYYFSKKLEQIAKLNANGKQVINLGIGSPDQAPPKEAIEKLIESVSSSSSHAYASYRSTPELRKAIGKWYKKAYQVELNPDENILPLLGSKEGILYLSMALLNPGDKVLVPNPGYPAYASAAKLIGAEIVYYDLTEESGWLPNFTAIEKHDLSNCKLMWINYPHMPTGTSAGENFFSQVVAFAKKHRIQVCNDNPYSLVLNSGNPQSLLSFDSNFEAVAELNSMSKAFNMAGWRVGMLMGSSKLINAVVAVKSNVDSGMFLPVQKGAIEALEASADWHLERNKVYEARRQHVWEIFDLLDLRYTKDQVGMFVWGKVPDSIADVTDLIDKILIEARVFLTPGHIFGSNSQRYIRASLCAPVEKLIEAKSRIKEFLK